MSELTQLSARALRDGEWVALMGDRAVPGLGGSLGAWASALARRTGAVVLPVATIRRPDGRHALWCDPPIMARAGLERRLQDALRRQLERASDRGQVDPACRSQLSTSPSGSPSTPSRWSM